VTVAAHAGIGIPRSGRLLARLRAFWRRVELDRQLAQGVAPDTSPALLQRSRVLSSWRVRHTLADGLESVIVEAATPPRRAMGAAVPVQREAVLDAQDDLLRLVAALRAEPAAPVRGIAMASQLLTDGAGPVFAPHPRGALREAVFQAAFQTERG
jgi:hypothetical protein